VAKLSAIRTDLKRAEEGTWVPFAEGIEVCIASLNTERFKAARRRLLKPHVRELRAGTAEAGERILELIKPAVARFIVVDWRNLQDDEGEPIPYSPEKCLELFHDPTLQDFYAWVLNTAGESELFRQELLDDAEKNS
jgi:hypothetical protein